MHVSTSVLGWGGALGAPSVGARIVAAVLRLERLATVIDVDSEV